MPEGQPPIKHGWQLLSNCSSSSSKPVPISYQSQASLSFPRCVVELRLFWLKTVQSVFHLYNPFFARRKTRKIAESIMTLFDLTRKSQKLRVSRRSDSHYCGICRDFSRQILSKTTNVRRTEAFVLSVLGFLLLLRILCVALLIRR